ncbi:queuosine precursor transporter [bacterium]|nr:queuosine precursor transporter [bacterium]
MRINVIYLIVFYVATLLIANVAAGRLSQLGPFVVTSATYIFALSFTLIDLINEALGKSEARRVVYAALGANVLMALYFSFVCKLPAPSWFGALGAYDTVLSQTPRIVLASLSAFLASGLLDVELFARLRQRLPAGWRVLASNAASTLLDSAVFVFAAFAGLPDFPLPALLQLILGQYVIKMAVTALSVPLIYLLRGTARIGSSPGLQTDSLAG